MKFLSLLFFLLIQLNVCAQFFGQLRPRSSDNYTSNYRSAHSQRLSTIKFHMSQIAELTNAQVAYEHKNLESYTVDSKRVSVDHDRKRTVERKTYTSEACRYVKAIFTGGLNATFEAWFNHYHSSNAIRIVFESEAQYLEQIKEIEGNKHYMRLSEDSLVAVTGEFWRKPKFKKLFGKEFMTLDPENLEINVIARYYPRKQYKRLDKKFNHLLLKKQQKESVYFVTFYSDSIKINDQLIQPDTLTLALDPNGTTRFVFWENENNKLSILVEVEDFKDKAKVKTRIEEYCDGKWRKPNLRIRSYRHIPIGLTHWESIKTVPFYSFTKEIRTLHRKRYYFEDKQGNKTEVNGYLMFRWAREQVE